MLLARRPLFDRIVARCFVQTKRGYAAQLRSISNDVLVPDKPSDAEIGEVNSFQNHMYDYPTNQSYTDILAFRGATHGPTKENPVPGRTYD